MVRTLAALDPVGVIRIERKESAAILLEQAGARHDHAGTEGLEQAVDERDRIAVRVHDRK
ncbi:MAG: hypothetical protein OXN89_11470 [Bryobacterales bacterium]|nr:hypothetical protein [Bryobacterales bacterium]